MSLKKYKTLIATNSDFANQFRTFQTMHSIRSNSLSLNYQRFTQLGSKDVVITLFICNCLVPFFQTKRIYLITRSIKHYINARLLGDKVTVTDRCDKFI